MFVVVCINLFSRVRNDFFFCVRCEATDDYNSWKKRKKFEQTVTWNVWEIKNKKGCVCVCVWERERERVQERVFVEKREIETLRNIFTRHFLNGPIHYTKTQPCMSVTLLSSGFFLLFLSSKNNFPPWDPHKVRVSPTVPLPFFQLWSVNILLLFHLCRAIDKTLRWLRESKRRTKGRFRDLEDFFIIALLRGFNSFFCYWIVLFAL